MLLLHMHAFLVRITPSTQHNFFVLSVMLGASEVHEMGKSMITLTRTKKVLDIGTFTGASALAWAIELPVDGKVISMDVDHTQLEKVGKSFMMLT